MEQYLRALISGTTLPALAVFLSGILTSVSPCTFATNIMALGYIARQIESERRAFACGLFYILGRTLTYSLLGWVCIYTARRGADLLDIQTFLADHGGKVLAVALLLFGLFLLFGSKLPLPRLNIQGERLKQLRGPWGAFVLGAVFAFAFCPISAMLFFGGMVPLAVVEPAGYSYPLFFSLGSGILVVAIAWVVSFAISSISRLFEQVGRVQRILNAVIAIGFILTGLYFGYLYFLAG